MRYLFPLLLLAFLTACGALPKPFQPSGKDLASAPLPADAGPLLVEPIRGVSPGLADGGAEALATALNARGVTATPLYDGRELRLLRGFAALDASGTLTDQLAITWEVIGPGGRIVAHAVQQIEVPKNRWSKGESGTLGLVLSGSADLVAAALLGFEAPQGQNQAAAIPEGPVSIRLAAFSGAPGDGNESLPRALTAALNRAGYILAGPGATDAYEIVGRMQVRPSAGSGGEDVTLVWEVFDPTGKRLGQAAQANTIPAGSLNGAWGDTAPAIAAGALEGIEEILKSVQGPGWFTWRYLRR